MAKKNNKKKRTETSVEYFSWSILFLNGPQTNNLLYFKTSVFKKKCTEGRF